MDELIDEIYRTGTVVDANGQRYPLHSHVDKVEGEFLTNFIRSREDIVRTLEVGCAYGLSSLHITKALQGRPGAHHVIVDPFQYKDYQGIGINNLKRTGIDFFELRQEHSELALPKLLEERPESFDLVFIDGWHTFDHTLIDLFYANRLIRVGGNIIVDDCNFRSVSKAVDYVSKYPCYKIAGGSPLPKNRRLASYIVRAVPREVAGAVLPRRFYDEYFTRTMFPSMVALQKIAPDERDWRWFESF